MRLTLQHNRNHWTIELLETDPVSETLCFLVVRFEVFTAVTIKNDVFWDVTPLRCEEISLHRASVVVTASVVPSSSILVTLMKESLSSSERSVFQEPHGVTSQKTPFFVVFSSCLQFRTMDKVQTLSDSGSCFTCDRVGTALDMHVRLAYTLYDHTILTVYLIHYNTVSKDCWAVASSWGSDWLCWLCKAIDVKVTEDAIRVFFE
jgi:hypothetical protein